MGVAPAVRHRPAQRNHRSVEQRPEVIKQHIENECQTGRLLGPVPPGLVAACQVSPIGLVPKSQPGAWRLIVDLSFPEGHSVNDGIESDLASMRYSHIDDAVRVIRVLGQGALLAKVDLKSAYRVIPVHRDDWHLLAIQWESHTYLDTALPFGLRSAPKLFSAVADALAWCMWKQGVRHQLHYLDDYLLLGPPMSSTCAEYLSVTLQLCSALGVPAATEKVEGPTTCLTFLGIEVDTVSQQLRLPQAKLLRLKANIKGWLGRKSCKKRQLQSLLGHLNHAAMVVRSGRSFLRRMIDCLSLASRPDHFIRLNREFQSDLRWWHIFVSRWNGISFIASVAPSITVTSDASGTWGCGAFVGNQWFQLAWPPSWSDIHITAKELVPIVLAAMIWGSTWSKKVVQFICDNQAVVSCLKSGSSRNPLVMQLLRCFSFICARYEFQPVSQHLSGKENVAADALSRNNMHAFFSFCPQANKTPIVVPDTMVDLLLISRPDWTSPAWTGLFGNSFLPV